MTDKMNGIDSNLAAEKAKYMEMDHQAQSFIHPVLICAVNGCQKSLQGYPLDRLMVMLAGMFGRCIGEVLSQGDLGPTMKLRRMCAETFEEEMKKVSIRPLPVAGQPIIDRVVGEQTAELMRKLKG